MDLPEYRIGSGYDVHRLAAGRELVLGGVTIPFEKGLHGHSDADVLVHSICDAILGAAGLGDLGEWFPDTDPDYRGISSIRLLENCCARLDRQGCRVANIDATVVAEKPKIAPYRQQMEERIAVAVRLAPEQVNVKGTTTEGLGFEGRGEGISARAVVLIRKQKMDQGR